VVKVAREVEILLNNTVLSNFAIVGRINLLQQAVAGKAGTTQQVLAEYQRGVEFGLLPPVNFDWLPVLMMDEQEQQTFELLRQRLGTGEASCLAIAYHRGLWVATDDRDARRYALQMNIALSGTIGILVGLVRAKVISLEEANALLSEMIRHGYRSPVTDLSVLLSSSHSSDGGAEV